MDSGIGDSGLGTPRERFALRGARLTILALAANATLLFGSEARAEDQMPIWEDRLQRAALYIPNRLFDALDVVRLRVRFGEGLSVNLRASESHYFNAGDHSSVYLGLPGPRMERSISRPVGTDLGLDPGEDLDFWLHADHYGTGEIGVGLHALLGFDVGVDVTEAIDLFLGFVFLDLKEDDL